MPRISLTEQYDNRDVIAQIYKMLDQVATGTFQSVDVQRVGGDYVFTFTDQNGDPHSFTVGADYVADVDMTRLNGVYTFTFTYAGGTTESFAFTVNGVQNIAAVQSGSTVTVTFTLDDGTTKTISYNAGGDMTTDTAQTVTAVKTFTASPLVPTAPAGSTDQTAANTNWISQTGDSSPNNLVHRSGGTEEINGVKKFTLLVDGLARRTVPPYNAPFSQVTSADWVRYFTMNTSNAMFSVLAQAYGTLCAAKFAVGGTAALNRSALIMKSSNFALSIISIYNTADNVFEIWMKATTTFNTQVSVEDFMGPNYPILTYDGVTTSAAEPDVDATHINKVVIV